MFLNSLYLVTITCSIDQIQILLFLYSLGFLLNTHISLEWRAVSPDLKKRFHILAFYEGYKADNSIISNKREIEPPASKEADL